MKKECSIGVCLTVFNIAFHKTLKIRVKSKKIRTNVNMGADNFLYY